ncbi:MAG: 30S ribosomal protein S6 [Phototrophicaceae bacterium]|jgi:small subunit ribosomal protein S6
MKRAYELALIVRMDPNQSVIDEVLNQVKTWVEADDLGEVVTSNIWGQRRLAYEIDKQRDGYYVFMNANIDPKGLNELETNLKLTPAVLRYLIVRQET